MQAFSHFSRANTLCSDLRMLLLTQSLPSRFHSHFPPQLLIKAHCNTHKITKYNHYKRIIHLKLLDSFIDHVLLCWSHTHTHSTQSNLANTKAQERVKLWPLLLLANRLQSTKWVTLPGSFCSLIVIWPRVTFTAIDSTGLLW